jgi:hypothetical protein
MAKKKPTADESGAAAPDDLTYPTVVYTRAPESTRWPNGYETRTVESPETLAALGMGWVHSPADL